MNRDWNKVFWDTFFLTVSKLAVLSLKTGYESTRWVEEISKQVGLRIGEGFHFVPSWKIERFKPVSSSPFDVSVFESNLALNEGLNVITALICGGSGTAYSNANAQTGVGTSATAAVATQTDLQAGGVWVGMDASYPTYGTSQQMVFKSTFGGTVANQSWQEFSIRNGAAADKNLNRKVQNEGTKPSGQIWIVTTTFTGS